MGHCLRNFDLEETMPMHRRIWCAFLVATGTVVSLLCVSSAATRARELSVTTLPTPRAAVNTQTLTLEQAKELALTNNKQLELARLNEREKQIAICAAKRDYLPKILGMGGYLHFNDNLGTVLATRSRQLGGATIGSRGLIQIPSITTVQRSISANVVNQDAAFGAVMIAQPITKLIGVSVLVDIAKADEGIAAAKLDQGTRDLLSGVSQAYYGLVAAKRIHAVLSLQAQAMEPLLKEKPIPEVRLGYLELRKGMVEIDKQTSELTEVLNQLLGLPPCTCLELIEPMIQPLMVNCADDAAQLALGNNPKVREAQQNITKAKAGLRAAKMDCLPDVNVMGAYIGQSAASYIQPDFGMVGLTASYTFWDWGKRKQVKLQRETQIALAHQNVDATVDDVQLDARKAFLAYRQATEDYQIMQEVVVVRMDAEKGAKQTAEVLSAKSATAKAQLDLMQAELNYRLAHAKLAAAIGQQ